MLYKFSFITNRTIRTEMRLLWEILLLHTQQLLTSKNERRTGDEYLARKVIRQKEDKFLLFVFQYFRYKRNLWNYRGSSSLMTMAETLFSLEVHVESVENLRVACKLPALCFRLLDFPTMIIHHVSPLDAEKMRQKLRLEGNESVLQDLKDRFGNFQFRKGKSCLFKASIDTLLLQLQTVPLYAMLMDLWPRKPVLVGSTLIPLKRAIDKISKDVYQKGIAVPSFYRDEGDFSVYNLMGSCIAKVKLGFRLLSLGGSLIPHIPTEALAKRSTERIETGGQIEQAVKGALEKVLPEIESGTFLEEHIPEDIADSETDGQTVKPSQTQDVKQTAEVQTYLHARDITSHIRSHDRRRSEEDLVITNTFCPPPLYYNCFSKSTVDSDSDTVRKTEPRILKSGSSSVAGNRQAAGRDSESCDVDFMYFEPSVVQRDGTVGVTSVSVQTDEKFPKPSVEPQSNGSQLELVSGLYNLRGLISDGHLPVLNALIQELSSLTGGHQTDTTTQPNSSKIQTTPRHPQKYSSKEKAKGVRKPVTSEKNAVHMKSSQHVSHPKSNQTSVIGLPKQRVRFKQTSLTYGMTKTQQMRLEMNQKDKLTKRRRPCEAHAAALAQKENKRTSLQETFGEGALGMTYKIGPGRKLLGGKPKQMADAQIQTQEYSSGEGLHEVEMAQPSSEEVRENREKPAVELVESEERSKTPNSVEVFIPQVEGMCTIFLFFTLAGLKLIVDSLTL